MDFYYSIQHFSHHLVTEVVVVNRESIVYFSSFDNNNFQT